MNKLAKAMLKAFDTETLGPSAEQNKRAGQKSKTVKLNKSHMARNLVIGGVTDPSVLDYYNLLRTQVLQRTRGEQKNVIMVTSALPGEGCSLTATNLAISIARELNQFALLVDTHLRNPVIDEYFGITTKRGLSDYLVDDVPLFDLLIRTDLDKLTLLPVGRTIAGSTEILGSPKMRTLVQEMKDRYPDRYVIFNCPPLLRVPDALVFSSYVDQILLVVEAGRTTERQIRNALDLLDRDKVLGMVLNKAKETL
ncbi:MAG: polysaccharide biosynthesis tyrosine autokinase [Desulfovibrio sp.]|nr:polysaccharide biosynthesis tyrosine autokinase [Desulfovibrio sp.]